MIRPSARSLATASGLHGSHVTTGAFDASAAPAAIDVRGQPTHKPRAPTRTRLAKPKRARAGFAPGAFHRPYIHTAIAISTRLNSTPRKPSSVVWAASTHRR